jgi:hypothetical protein
MKNEEFDDAVRKKLEGIGQSYSEADIDKVMHHLARQKPSILQWLKGKWYIPVISVAALVGVSLWMLGEQKPGIQVSNDKPQTEIVVQPGLTEAPDTLIESVEPGKEISLSAPSIRIVTPKTTEVQIDAGHESNPSTPKQTDLSGNVEVVDVTDHENFKDLEATIQNEAPLTLQTSNLLPDPVQLGNSAIISVQSAQLPLSEKPVVSSPDIAGYEDANRNNVLEEKEITKSNKEENIALQKNQETAKVKVGNSWALNSISLAAQTRAGSQSFGGGFTGEFLLGKHFGINTGIRYSMFYPEKFRDREDLNDHRHHRMHPGIEEHFSKDDKFTDIEIRNRIFQVPFGISYHIFLKKQLDLSFGLGTDIDFFVNQKVDLLFPKDSIEKEPKHFKADGKVVPFNNLVLSASIEKRWNRFAVQLSPFVSPALQEVFYRPRDLEYGIGLNIRYYIK